MAKPIESAQALTHALVHHSINNRRKSARLKVLRQAVVAWHQPIGGRGFLYTQLNKEHLSWRGD